MQSLSPPFQRSQFPTCQHQNIIRKGDIVKAAINRKIQFASIMNCFERPRLLRRLELGSSVTNSGIAST